MAPACPGACAAFGLTARLTTATSSEKAALINLVNDLVGRLQRGTSLDLLQRSVKVTDYNKNNSENQNILLAPSGKSLVYEPLVQSQTETARCLTISTRLLNWLKYPNSTAALNGTTEHSSEPICAARDLLLA